jgi:hypothetical protein
MGLDYETNQNGLWVVLKITKHHGKSKLSWMIVRELKLKNLLSNFVQAI